MGFYRSIPMPLSDRGSYTYLINGQLVKGSVAPLVNLGFDNQTFDDAVVIGDNVSACINALAYMTNFNNIVILGRNVEDCSYLFYSCYNYNRSIDIPDNVKNMYGMFTSCRNFNTEINISNNVTSYAGLYKAAYNFNMPVTIPNHVTNIAEMFSALLSSQNSLWNYSLTIPNNIYNSWGLFYRSDLFNNEIILLPGDDNSIMNYSNMFYNANGFNQPINIPKGGSIDCSNMFNACPNFDQPITFSTETLNYNFSYMFNNCQKFNQIIDFYELNVEDTSYMFRNCNNLTVKPTNIFQSNIKNCDGMYQNCLSLFDYSNDYSDQKRTSNMTPNNVVSAVGMFRNTTVYQLLYVNDDRNINNYSQLKNAAYMFSNCKNLNALDYNNFTVLPSIENAHRMFENCKCFNFRNIKFGGFKSVSSTDPEIISYNLIDASYMFVNSNVTNLSTYNHYRKIAFKYLENAQGMFENCKELNEISLFYYNYYNKDSDSYMNNLTDTSKMFENSRCLYSGPTTVNPLSYTFNFDLCPNLINSSRMFANVKSPGIQNIGSINLPNRLEDASSMFEYYGYSSVGQINIYLNIPQSVKNVYHMFNNTTNLSGDIRFFNNKYALNNLAGIIGSYKNNSYRLNLYMEGGTSTQKLCATTAASSILSKAITWTSSGTAPRDYKYNSTFNIYVYNYIS